ncbi:MAG: hemolysin III family protein [Planctomycetota bacterium]
MTTVPENPTASVEAAAHRPQTIGEEIANAVTHGIGFGLAISGLAILCVYSTTSAATVGAAIFGSMNVFMYLMSTLYHSLPDSTAKRVFQRLDHIGVFLVIAGTYTPLTLTYLRNESPAIGWTLFGIVWAFAVVGIVFKAIFGPKRTDISLIIYTVMGWLIVIALGPVLRTDTGRGLLTWLAIGGACYTVGILFFIRSEKHRFFHFIWHLFVLAGGVCHFFLILFYFM